MSETIVKKYQAKRDIALKRLHDAKACAERCKSDKSLLPRLETWCSRVDDLIETFSEAHLHVLVQLETISENDPRIVLQSQYQEEADDIYLTILEAKRTLLSTQNKESNASNSNKKSSKLPAIKLPSFSGQLKDFPGYIDLYNTLVHNRTDLSNVEKFQYFISTLSGEPINIIRAFTVSEANYISAYDAVVNRYSNKRYLAFVCWEQITNSKSMSSGSAQSLRSLLDLFSENISMLHSLGLPTDNWDFVLFHALQSRLDKASREAFELSCNGNDFPTFCSLKKFLQERCNALERSTIVISSTSSNQTNVTHSNVKRGVNQTKPPTMLLAQGATGIVSCVMCKDNHALYFCPKFLDKTPSERSQYVKQNKLCFNCLRANHSSSECKSLYTCKTCNQRHNSLLHFPKNQAVNNNSKNQKVDPVGQKSNQTPSTNDENIVTPVTTLSNVSSPCGGGSFVMLATAEVEVRDGVGNFQVVRVLIDPGSQTHIITNSCARRLSLARYKANFPMYGIGEVPTQSSAKVFLEIRPKGQLEPTFSLEAVTLEKICANMPSHAVDVDKFKHIANLKLADDRFDQARPIDILLGGEIFPQILLPGKLEADQAATALNTIFGFVLMGKTATLSKNSTPLSVNHLSMDASLDVAVQKFWEMEDVSSFQSNQSSSVDDIRCEEIYNLTHDRDSDGRYIVHLPFRDEEPVFEDSYQIAVRRFKQLERRLLLKPEFHEEYKQHVMEYLSTEQMDPVPPEECQSATAYYIPHHAVVKPDRKLRVVYDASTKDKKGLSLNNTLFTGSKLQADISEILLRFRLHPVVLCADVRQMYRQIKIADKHKNYQRIVFRSSPTEEIQEYCLNRVTFGVSCAPFLAIRTMLQLAQDEQENFPAAANILKNDLYVDDIVTGCESIDQAIILQQQLVNIMAAGKFELRKWSSNQMAVLQNIPEDHKAVPNVTFDSDSHFVKILGLAWNAKFDIFNYQVNQITRVCSKRTMLSELARIYDPVGLLTPLTFLAKHLIQRLWLLGTSWDEPVPEEIKQIWNVYTQQLPLLDSLEIPRQVTRNDSIGYQLHGFCDASEAGYAAAVYLRSTNSDMMFNVILVSGRSRVAPTKRRTLPRLELCGAALLADLMQHIIQIYSKVINIESVYAWSDSTIVLSWIKSNSINFKAFVGNRISNIQRKIPNATWKHVPGKQNPSDCASRGLTPEELIQHPLWWRGPEWLSLDQSEWPSAPPSVPLNELQDSLMDLVKHVQQQDFGEIIGKYQSKSLLPKTFRKLNPFLDNKQIFRVGGRLSQSDLNFEVKHPALLPRKHRLTQLIIQCVHNENLHPGLQSMQYLLLQNFWILSPRRAIRQVISNCVRCFRVKPSHFEPEMADLPRSRITQLKAFQSVGCDYAGPFNITFQRYRGTRSMKAYLCLFVCFATKALHLELASSLSSDSFLAALRRFIARRGRCNIIHSDCGTNFKGAESQLADLMRSACVEERIEFKFNPPGAPHFGGLWEAGVKSVKTHLYRVIGTQILTYEELNTLLTQVESVLNSRPLCPLSTDPQDISVLTPGHFLTLAPLTSVPTPDYSDIKLNKLNRWQLIQQMHQHFWTRWHNEYLTTLSQRLKWTKSAPNAILDQLVIIKEESNHPLRWHLGRIIKLFPGRDGVVRSALVKTSHGVLNRPLVKLCPLPNELN